MNLRYVTAALAALSVGPMVHAHEALQHQQAIIESVKNMEATSKGTPLPTAGQCSNSPLPLTPQEPIYDQRRFFTNSSEEVQIITWRLPCDSLHSLPIITLRPTIGEPFVCREDIIQDGLQLDDFFLVQGVAANSFCDDLLIEASFTIEPVLNSPLNIDH